MEPQKDKFFLADDACYLNCAYMSPLLKSVEQAGIDGIRLKRNPFLLSPSNFFEPIQEVRELFSELMSIRDPMHVVIVPSVSYALANVASNIPVKPGDNIVIPGEQFPSNYYVWQRICQEKDLTLRTVSAPNSHERRGEKWNREILEAIDPRTAAVAISHVHWADGTIFQLDQIGRKLRESGGLLIVDGTQSFGAFPFDQDIIQADAFVCSAYKWLMGPYGIGLAFYGSAFDGGRPIEESWMNRLYSDDFANLVNYQSAYRPAAMRYQVGEASNFIHIPMVASALKQILEWGVENIQYHCAEISRDCLERLKTHNFWVEEEGSRAHHLFGIRVPKGISMPRLRKHLADNNISISIRGNAIRVSPHVYNTVEDLELLGNSLIQALD